MNVLLKNSAKNLHSNVLKVRSNEGEATMFEEFQQCRIDL